MSGPASFLLSYLVNLLWQVPLILLAAWIAARVLRPIGPVAEHRAWVTALVLASAVPALSMLPWERLYPAWPWHAQPAAVSGQVTVAFGAGNGFRAFGFPPPIARVLLIGYLSVTAYFAIRFAWHCLGLSGLSRTAEQVAPEGDLARTWTRWMRRFDARRVVLASSAQVVSPVMIGVFEKRVLLPAGLLGRLDQRELETVIAHELAHASRNDFVKNLLYELMFLPLSYHPAAWFIRQQMTETREMICDRMAAQSVGNGRYAQSLLHLASLLIEGKPIRVPQAIGVFDSNTLERRLMKLIEKQKEVGRLRRLLLAGGCVVLGLATAGSALALRLAVDGSAANDHPAQKKVLSVPPKQMETRIVSKVTPKYPPAAKEARVEGTVQLRAVIGKTGHVENVKVVSGPNQLQASAVDAVRQWVYKPFLLNGEPVEVKTTVSIVYSLKK